MNRDEQNRNHGVTDAGLGVAAGVLGSTAAVALLGTGTAGAIVGGVAPPALVLAQRPTRGPSPDARGRPDR